MLEKELMGREISVSTGQVKTGSQNDLLRANGIGSCVVVVAYDLTKTVGGMAHIMLPGHAPEKGEENPTKYAENTIDELIAGMERLGAHESEIETCLVGGGNVLRKEDDTICRANLSSIEKYLAEKGLKIRRKAVGGLLRRTVSLDISRRCVSYTEGNSGEMELYKSVRAGN